MTITVQQLAKELGLKTEALFEAVDTLELNIPRHPTAPIKDRDADELRSHLNVKSPSGVETKEKEVKAGVTRRRRKVVDEGGPIRRRAAKPAAEPAPEAEAGEDSAAAEAPAEAPQPAAAGVSVRPRRKVATVVSARAKAAEEQRVAEEEAAQAAAEEEAARLEAEAAEAAKPVVRRSSVATIIKERPEEPAAVEAAEPAEEPEEAEPVRRPRMATVIRQRDDDARQEDLTPMQRAAMARREVDHQAAARGASAAVVVGTVNPDLLHSRLGFERRDAGRGPRPRVEEAPGGKARRSKRRVVQNAAGRDRFDRGRRGRRGRQKGVPLQQTKITVAAEHKRVIKMEEAIAVSDLAQQMGVKGGELVKKLAFDLGLRGISIGSTIDFDTATILADEYEHTVEQVGFDITKYLPTYKEDEKDIKPRPPVVTVMGHVDHGKTSLLDAIRKAQVRTGEAGGITQHIGAYKVSYKDSEIAFLDTPGHEAFTALRARGAKATDIVILVVAADDGVMPQTVEAINHAKDAEVPIVVAINKIDKPTANPDRIKQALTEYGLVSEEWGGDTIFAEISALKGTGIDELMDVLLLQAEMLELKANPKRPAQGVVIESRLDVGRGPVATILVQQGTLKSGDIVVIGQYHGRIRTMVDEFQKRYKVATVSTPVEITGLSGVPDSGETFYVVSSERDARAIADHISVQNKQAELALSISSTGDGMQRIAELMRAGEVKELKVIVKGDVQGSVEALNDSLRKLSTEKVNLRVIHSGVGAITESDVNLAASSDEGVGVVLVSFNTKIDSRAQAAIDQQKVTVVQHTIIYDIINDIRAMMAGLLEPIYVEEYLGKAEVRKLFRITKVGTVLGCMVLDGLVARNAKARVMRNGETVLETTIDSLKHFERDEREVKAGFECGISLSRSDGIEEGDIIEAFRLKATQATL